MKILNVFSGKRSSLSFRYCKDNGAKIINQKLYLGKALLISLANQVISSGTNFVLSIFLVRMLSPLEFGLYGIGIAVSLFYAGIGNALFLIQMVVIYPDKQVEERPFYIGRMFIAIIIFSLLTIILFYLSFFIGGSFLPKITAIREVSIATLAASLAYLFKDFFVRYSYILRKESFALVMNLLVAISLVVLFGVYPKITNGSLSAGIALWICSLSNIIGAMFGFLVSRIPFQTNFIAVLDDTKEAWRGGWWAVAGNCIAWVKSQSFMIISTIFLGPIAVGQANAARLFVVPLTLMVPAINQIILPRLADVRNNNRKRLFLIGKWYAVFLLSGSLLYFAILLSCLDYVAIMVLGESYENSTALVIAWCIVIFFQFAWTSTSSIMQVLKRFRLLAIVNGAGALVAIISSIVLVKIFGNWGAVAGTAVGEFILAIILYHHVYIESMRDEKC